jgi:hypothetical protein
MTNNDATYLRRVLDVGFLSLFLCFNNLFYL